MEGHGTWGSKPVKDKAFKRDFDNQLMETPKLSTLNVDTERLVRDFLAAVNSLAAPAPALACPSPREPERAPETCPIPEIDAAESESLEELAEGAEDSEDEDGESAPDRHRIFEEFSNDNELLERLKVTPQELQTLSSPSLFGSLTSKADLLFILRQIRRGSTPDETKTIAFDSRPAPDERIEKSPRDFREMTERIRREAMARLEQPVETSGWSWSQMWRRRAA